MKKSKLWIVVVLVAAMAVSLFAGCSTTQPADEERAPSTEAAQETAEETEAASEEAADDITLYFLLKTLSNPHWVTMKEGIEEAAAEAGVTVFVDAMNSEDEISPQLDKLMTAVNGDYDGLGLAPISPTNLIEGVVAANQKGIPVFNIDEKIDETELNNAGGYVVGFATTDNKAVGQKGAEYIIEQLGAEGGKVAIIEGKAGAASGEDRRVGANEAFEAAQGVELVDSQPADWDRNKALDVATNIISQNPDIKGFYCCNDTMALGVQEAVENADLKDVCIVVGTDGIEDAIASVKEGRLAATVAQDPAQIGRVSFEKLYAAVQAGDTGSLEATPEIDYIDSILITKDNA